MAALEQNEHQNDGQQNGNGEQKFFRPKPDSFLGIGITQVYEKGVKVVTDRPIYQDPNTERIKVYLTGRVKNPSFLVFQREQVAAVATKPVSLDQVYGEIHFRVPRRALLGREDEKKPFESRRAGAGQAYYFVRWADPRQKGQAFKPVFIKCGEQAFKVTLAEQGDTMGVFIVYINPRLLPACFRRSGRNGGGSSRGTGTQRRGRPYSRSKS